MPDLIPSSISVNSFLLSLARLASARSAPQPPAHHAAPHCSIPRVVSASWHFLSALCGVQDHFSNSSIAVVPPHCDIATRLYSRTGLCSNIVSIFFQVDLRNVLLCIRSFDFKLISRTSLGATSYKQNPPAVPSLFVVRVACWLRCSRFVIDWHNFGYTILGLSKGAHHWSVRLSRWYERTFGRGAYANFCVTRAMAAFLGTPEWGVATNTNTRVLYDRPPALFRRLDDAERHALFVRLETEHAAAFAALHTRWFGEQPEHLQRALSGSSSAGADGSADGSGGDTSERVSPPSTTRTSAPRSPRARANTPRRRSGTSATSSSSSSTSASATATFTETTLFTTLVRSANGSATGATVRPRADRPALLVSSTSWTEDEDFSILLDAIEAIERECAANDGDAESAAGRTTTSAHSSASSTSVAFPRVLIIITGKGPQRAMYEARIARMRARRCAVLTLWLAAEDYPRLLGAADVGVSLHTSSSGLDLPMKV
jgi:beta-1,4-mannosyltransferase